MKDTRAESAQRSVEQSIRILSSIFRVKEMENKLKPGTKVIFVRDGGLSLTPKGAVFTFRKFKRSDFNDPFPSDYSYFEVEEIDDHLHGFNIFDVEVFDPEFHSDKKMMTKGDLR